MNTQSWQDKRMRIAIGFIVLLLVSLLVVWWAANRYNWFNKEVATVPVPAAPAPNPAQPKPASIAYKVETISEGLFVPWSIVFTSPSRMLVTERNGAVRVVEGGKLQSAALVKFTEVATGGEEGLMGLAADPNYAQNKLLYTCLAYESGGRMKDKVVRFEDKPGGGERKTIFDNIPAATYHAGCRVKFGPDSKLYVTTGDAGDKAAAQDLKSLAGKILRFNSDGSIPGDNPFGGSAVWSYGHRNPQGISWQPGTNALVATEHGPSGFDGPLGGDEVNVIEKGKNYGWPLVSHKNKRSGTEAPIVVFTPAVAPGSGHFYRSEALPQFNGNYFFGMLRGEGLYRIAFDKTDVRKIISREKVKDVNVGRVREVTEGPDGAIYFTTSNRDGRGTVHQGDDKIYRLTPQP